MPYGTTSTNGEFLRGAKVSDTSCSNYSRAYYYNEMTGHILVTGGAGYIGSHTVVELLAHGYKVVIVDNLVNSSYDAVARIGYISQQNVPFFNADIRDHDALLKVFQSYQISGVIHFAALKAVGESTRIPLDYYANNIIGTLNLVRVMQEVGVKTIVFSSSATVYGDATRFENMIPIPEFCPTGPTNPYGRTKLMIEQILSDLHRADGSWRAAILRYFNPMGAHPSGLLGEDPLGIPNNLLPYLAQVAVGRREKLQIFGQDYDSHDGTPIRDYVHVVDLARGHIAALAHLAKLNDGEGLYREWNLGTGKGSTVFDVYNAFCKSIGRELPYEVVGRRSGDVLNLTAHPERANTELGWYAQLTIEQACADLWKWTQRNPLGFNLENYSWRVFGEEENPSYDSRLHTISLPGSKFEVSIANYGATIQSIAKDGKPMVLGFDSLEGYRQNNNPFFGATIGRYANRIGGARFTLDGTEYSVSVNENGSTCLHGGSEGFDKKTFLGPVVTHNKELDEFTLDFVYVDKDGSNGFPSDVVTHAIYVVGKDFVQVEYTAEILELSEKSSTAVNLTNHSYFLLGDSSLSGITVKTASNEILSVDQKLIPTGNTENVLNDLLEGQVLADHAYDNCFIMEKSDWALDTRNKPLTKIVEAKSSAGDVNFQVYTTEPAFQLYTGDFVNTGSHKGRSGFCVEPSRYIDAINNEEWKKQVVLRKGEIYGSIIKYAFE